MHKALRPKFAGHDVAGNISRPRLGACMHFRRCSTGMYRHCCLGHHQPCVSGQARVCRRGGQQEQQSGNEHLISVQFGWGGEIKDVSSLFIGTSPEFELALYTLCFLAGAEENVVQVGGYEVKIRCCQPARLAPECWLKGQKCWHRACT